MFSVLEFFSRLEGSFLSTSLFNSTSLYVTFLLCISLSDFLANTLVDILGLRSLGSFS